MFDLISVLIKIYDIWMKVKINEDFNQVNALNHQIMLNLTHVKACTTCTTCGSYTLVKFSITFTYVEEVKTKNCSPRIIYDWKFSQVYKSTQPPLQAFSSLWQAFNKLFTSLLQSCKSLASLCLESLYKPYESLRKISTSLPHTCCKLVTSLLL